MFLDEARLAARLNHKNVVQTNEVELSGGEYFMAMEYLDGQPLNRVIARARELGRPIPLGVVSRVIGDALAGLHYAHKLHDYDGTPLHIVHRDVSPQNVFVTYDGQVKIVDFGIAKAARRAVETQTGVLKGKVSYMAPEQAFASSAEIDGRADVFSVGVMLWELLADRRLWKNMGDPEIIASLMEDVPSILEVKPELDAELARVCDKALARERENRFASAAELRAALERAAPPASVDELGLFVEGLFGDQRKEIKARIARQVELVARGADGDLLDLDRGSLPRGSFPDSASVPPRTLSSRPPPSGMRPITRQTEASATPVASATPAEGTLTSALFAEPEPRGRWTLRALVAVLATAGAIATWMLISGPRPAETRAAPSATANAGATAATAAPSALLAPSSAPAGAYIQLHLGANPAEAHIVIDGAPLPSNPFDGKFLKDGAVHRIQVEAPGFNPQTRVLVFDKDQSLDLTLSQKPKSTDAPGMKPDPYK
jgi:serine/threonine-protein kinase